MKISIPVFSTLGVAFIILKLCKVIDWSWWWVTAPFWGGIAIVIALMILSAIFVSAAVALTTLFKQWK